MKKVRHNKTSICQALAILIASLLLIIPGSASVFSGIDHHTNPLPNERGNIIYVDDNNTAGPWDGTLEHPYQFIQDGVDHAIEDDTVYVFNGSYLENIIVSKSIQLIGENKDQVYLSGYDFGTVVKIVAENVFLSEFTIAHCGSNPNNAGIMIHTSNNTITNTNIQFNKNFGVYVLAKNNMIYHNNFIENTYQAYDIIANSTWDGGYPTGGNYWSDYNGTDENEDGIGEIPYPTGNSSADRYPLIHPYGSIYNTETDEIFISIQAAISDNNTQNGQTIIANEGIYFEHLLIFKSIVLQGRNVHDTVIDGRFFGDVVTISTSGVTVQGFRIQHSGVEEQNAGIVVGGKNSSLLNNIIYQNFHGILLKCFVEDTLIVRNEIQDNRWNGITLKLGCKGTHIFENTISDNFYAGIGVSEASYNYIYHNNFKSNRHQAYDDATNIWDNGYPSGGNYWSDYTGSDVDGDGIGDTPYAILEGINTDRYPLIAPYTGGDTTPPVVSIQTPRNGVYLGSLCFFSWLFKKSTIIYGPIVIQVAASDAQSGIKQIEFLIDESDDPLFVDDQAPYSWRWSKPSFLLHKHTIIVVAYDNAGNHNFDMLECKKYY